MQNEISTGEFHRKKLENRRFEIATKLRHIYMTVSLARQARAISDFISFDIIEQLDIATNAIREIDAILSKVR